MSQISARLRLVISIEKLHARAKEDARNSMENLGVGGFFIQKTLVRLLETACGDLPTCTSW